MLLYTVLSLNTFNLDASEARSAAVLAIDPLAPREASSHEGATSSSNAQVFGVKCRPPWTFESLAPAAMARSASQKPVQIEVSERSAKHFSGSPFRP